MKTQAHHSKKKNTDLLSIPSPLHVDWESLNLATVDNGRELPDLTLALHKRQQQFTAQVPFKTKSLIDAVRSKARERGFSRSQCRQVLVLSWCLEEALLGLDLTKPRQAAEWERRTTFFMERPQKIAVANSTDPLPTLPVASVYHPQIQQIIVMTAKRFGDLAHIGWVVYRLVAIALTDSQATTTEVA
ncbi:MAG: hypothetical protein ACFCA4_18795 [Cyanophyceae cyanobacterium]